MPTAGRRVSFPGPLRGRASAALVLGSTVGAKTPREPRQPRFANCEQPETLWRTRVELTVDHLKVAKTQPTISWGLVRQQILKEIEARQWIADWIVEHFSELERLRKKSRNKCLQRVGLADNALDLKPSPEAASLLTHLLQCLEGEMARIIGDLDRDVINALHLLRWIPVSARFWKFHPLFCLPACTVARRAVLKYAKAPHVSRDYVVTDQGITPKDQEPISDSEAQNISLLFLLATTSAHYVVCKNVLSKGVPINFSPKGGQPQSDHPAMEAVAYWNERWHKYVALGFESGLTGLDTQVEATHEAVLDVPTFNVYDVEVEDAQIGLRFMPSVISLRLDFRRLLDDLLSFRDRIIQDLGVDVELLISFLVGLRRYAIGQSLTDKRRRAECYFGDCLLWQEAQFQPRKDVEEGRRALGLPSRRKPIREQRLTDVLRWLEVEGKSRKQWDIFDDRNAKLIFQFEETILVDFMQMLDVVRETYWQLESLPKRRAAAKIRADRLPQQVRELLDSLGKGHVWAFERVVHFPGEEKSEIDVGFIIEDITFVIECKSHTVDDAFTDDPIAVQKRLNWLESNPLKQVTKLAKRLARFPQGSGYQLPQEAGFIVPLVVTQYPEFLPNFSSKWFVYERQPRICLLQELVDLVDIENLDKARSAEGTLTVRRA